MKTTEQKLVDRYGLLLTVTHLAELLHQNETGLRMTLRGNSDFAKKMQPVRQRIGRRYYFLASDVAKLLDGENQCSA